MAAAVVFRSFQLLRPTWLQPQGARGMATLKTLSMRLKSVKNIEKITKSMKMVSAAKYSQAERELKPARTYGRGALSLFEKAEIVEEEHRPSHLIVAISSDRGLCGGIHSNVAKNVKATMEERPSDSSTAIVCIGDKARIILQRTQKKNIMLSFNEVGKQPPVFVEAAFIAQQILNSGLEYQSAEVVFSKFKNVVSYSTTSQPIISLGTLAQSEKILQFDDVDADVLQCYHEISLANLLFYAMKEAACSEQSSRMTSMDAASKNAADMIDRLALTYNRTRQAVITTALIEIISGAAAL